MSGMSSSNATTGTRCRHPLMRLVPCSASGRCRCTSPSPTIRCSNLLAVKSKRQPSSSCLSALDLQHLIPHNLQAFAAQSCTCRRAAAKIRLASYVVHLVGQHFLRVSYLGDLTHSLGYLTFVASYSSSHPPQVVVRPIFQPLLSSRVASPATLLWSLRDLPERTSINKACVDIFRKAGSPNKTEWED